MNTTQSSFLDGLNIEKKKEFLHECYKTFINLYHKSKSNYVVLDVKVTREDLVQLKNIYLKNFGNDQERRLANKKAFESEKEAGNKKIDRYEKAFNLFIVSNNFEKDALYLAQTYAVKKSTVLNYPKIYFEKYASPEEKKRYLNKLNINNLDFEKTIAYKKKKAYVHFIKNRCSILKMIELTAELNVSYDTLMRYVDSYANSINSESLKEYKKHVNTKESVSSLEKIETKYFYDLIIRNKANKDLLKEVVKDRFSNLVSVDNIFDFCDIYLNKYATVKEKNTYKETSNKIIKQDRTIKKVLDANAKYNQMFEEFLEIKTKKDLYTYALENGFKQYRYLSGKTVSFVSRKGMTEKLRENDKKDLTLKIEKRLKKYHDILLSIREDKKKSRHEDKKLSDKKLYHDVVSKIITSESYDLSNIFKHYGINNEKIPEIISYLQTYEPDKLKIIKDKIEKHKINLQFGETEEIEYFVKKLSKEKLDIIDYFLYTKVELKKALAICKRSKNLNNKEKAVFNKFFNIYRLQQSISELEKRACLNTKTEINLKRDSNGIPIPGTGRFIEDHEIENIFNFLEENDIPFTKVNFSAALRKYIQNDCSLSFQKENKKR